MPYPDDLSEPLPPNWPPGVTSHTSWLDGKPVGYQPTQEEWNAFYKLQAQYRAEMRERTRMFEQDVRRAMYGHHISRWMPAWRQLFPDFFDGLGKYVAMTHPRFADKDLTDFFLGTYPSPYEVDLKDGVVRFPEALPNGAKLHYDVKAAPKNDGHFPLVSELYQPGKNTFTYFDNRR